MPEIIFSRTRHEYDSYVDFWNLVTLSKFNWVYYDQIDWESDNYYIHSPMNGNFREMMSGRSFDRKCTIAHWLLERPEGHSLQPFIDTNQELVDMSYIDHNIVSDPMLARETGFHYVPMGSHADLGVPGTDKEWDFIGLLAPTPRREFIYGTANVTFAPNTSPTKHPVRRHDRLMRSRFGLNIHKDDWQFCEPLRFCLFAAYGLPILTETIFDETIYHHGCVISTYGALEQAMRAALEHYDTWKEWGMWLRHKLTTECSFRKMIEEHV